MGLNIQWYDALFLLMLAISAVAISIKWDKYQNCSYPMQIWILVDYATIFIFHILTVANHGLSESPWLHNHNDNLQMVLRLKGRVIVLVCLAFFLYPFLWAWTIVGCLWLSSTRNCIPEGPRWGLVIWLSFSYFGLLWILYLLIRKWLVRRHTLLQSSPGMIVSELQVLMDLIRVPDPQAFQVMDTEQEMRVGLEAATYHPGLFLTQPQRDAIQDLIQQLPKFHLKTVPTECSECPICLEEFHAGNEVRGLPCAHNFHVGCIDEWLRLNIKCPRCRCSVFPNLDLSALGGGNTRRLHGVSSMYFGGDVPS